MTGPYQPPGGDINSPFGAPDPTSPFTPAPGSGNADAAPAPKDEEESSSAGIQYELEAPGQPPMTPPPGGGPGYPQMPTSGGGYGPPPPPPGYGPVPGPSPYMSPPQKKSGNGLLIGGIIAGLVVLVLVVGVVMIVVTVGGDNGGGSADNGKYKVIASPCSDVDLSPVRALAEFTTEPTPSSSEYGTYGSASCMSATLGDYASSSYGYFSMYIYTYSDVGGAESMYETDLGSSGVGGCGTKNEISGNWAKGTLASGTGSSCAMSFVTDGTMTALVIQDANLEAKLTLDATNDLAGGAEDALKSVADSLLTAAKA